MILKARPANGWLSSAERAMSRVSVSSPGLKPMYGGTSSGVGRKSITAFSIGCTPLFLNAEPQSTGTNFIASVPLRTSARRVATSGSAPSR